MSMTTLTILQFTGIFCAYSFLTVLLPAFVLREKLRGRRVAEQFFISFLAGNFYIMNLVFLFQLLHISCWVTLFLGTVIPVTILWIRINRIPFREFLSALMKKTKRVSEGKLGLRTVLGRMADWCVRRFKNLWRIFCRVVVNRPVQWLFLGAILAGLFWIYGRRLLLEYGYAASDIPVHIKWINAMGKNDIFTAGVYPFGFHCIIYYLHTVFGIDTYVLMRLFAFVQNIYIHLVLLGFLKLCCKTKYLPYAGVFAYTVGNYFNSQTYIRYFSTLPQEFGMLFILPAVYFGFSFFEKRQEELKAGQKKKKESFLCLVCFAMSFSMTLAVHFYGTMIAGLFCVGIAAGYFFLFIRRRYFWNIIATGLISVLIAVLPMGIAFATGTPLQGSLGWGMSVISKSSEEETETQEEEKAQEQETVQEEEKTQQEPSEKETKVQQESSGEEELSGEFEVLPDTVVTEDYLGAEVTGIGIVEKLRWVRRAAGQLSDMTYGRLDEYIVPECVSGSGYLILNAIGLLFGIGSVFWIFRRRQYGAMLISVSVFMMIMTALQSASILKLPALMDPSRCSIYYAYMLPIVFVLAADGILYFVFAFQKLSKIRNFLSLVLAVCVIGLLFREDRIKEVSYDSDFVTNEAITCLTNIIREEEDFTWTICSANDETEMAADHGWHYEIISLLREMEHKGSQARITIPTETVYFFIEKVPLNYAETYAGSGQSVSVKGAGQPLPNTGGVSMYQGENRWIVMSRMYYWAQEFKRLYPNEMQVYLETDRFICYKIEQNMYHLFNFAIDYGYNGVEHTDAEE